jgi:5-methylthioadenosine/S-adenosylhomocysteine deaminase
MSEITDVRAGWLVVSADRIYKDTGFRIRDGIVQEILPNKELTGNDLWDFSDMIVCHSFSDMHSHLYSSLLKNISMPQVQLRENLETFWWPQLENRQTAETIGASAAYSAMQHLSSGCTFVNDILEAPLAEEGERLNTEENILRRAGIKGVLALESNERISRENGLSCLAENEDFVKRHKTDPAIKGAICTHTLFSSCSEFLSRASGMAREHDSLFEFHMNEGKEEPEYAQTVYGMSTAEFYVRYGIWQKGMHIFANQCSCLTSEEMKIMSGYGIGVASQPESNALEGSGIADVQGMLRAGIRVSLGTDAGEGNMFELMRLMLLMQRGLNGFDDGICERNIFRIAVENGPVSVGFAHCGTLEKDSCADFLALKTEPAVPLTEKDIIPEIIWNMNPDSIYCVVTDGKIRYENGSTTGIDREQVISDFRKVYRSFWNRQH